MFRGFHAWRVALHMTHGQYTMAIAAMHADPNVFTFTDALILVGYLQGRRERMDEIFGPRAD